MSRLVSKIPQFEPRPSSRYLERMSSNLKEPRHPEDAIFEVKTFVNQLSAVQEEKFQLLCTQLRLDEKGKDWLFDYVYNCDEDLSFDEYLVKHGVAFEECTVAPLPA